MSTCLSERGDDSSRARPTVLLVETSIVLISSSTGPTSVAETSVAPSSRSTHPILVLPDSSHARPVPRSTRPIPQRPILSKRDECPGPIEPPTSFIETSIDKTSMVLVPVSSRPRTPSETRLHRVLSVVGDKTSMTLLSSRSSSSSSDVHHDRHRQCIRGPFGHT